MFFSVANVHSNEAEPDSITNFRSYSFTVGTGIGFVYGKSLELVYPYETKGELLSELLWEMRPVFFAKVYANFGRTDLFSAPGFFSSLSFRVGFPGDSGIHENLDWMSIENDALTHFSSHTNRTRQFYWFDALIGVTLPAAPFMYFKPFINLSWMHFAFTGRDGHGIYARQRGLGFYPIDDDPHRRNFFGDVIRYQQHWFLAAAGVAMGARIRQSLYLNLSFQVSPFTYCAAIDEHLSASYVTAEGVVGSTFPRTFMDFTHGGSFLDIRAGISYKINNFSISMEMGHRRIGRTKGRAYMDQGNTGFFHRAGYAGAALSVLDFSLLVRYRI